MECIKNSYNSRAQLKDRQRAGDSTGGGRQSAGRGDAHSVSTSALYRQHPEEWENTSLFSDQKKKKKKRQRTRIDFLPKKDTQMKKCSGAVLMMEMPNLNYSEPYIHYQV